MASVLRVRGHEVQVVDANCEELQHSEVRNRIRGMEADMVAFRFTQTTIHADMEVANSAKSVCPDATTVGICWTLRTFANEIVRDEEDSDVYLMGEYGAHQTTLVNLLEARNWETVRETQNL